MSKVTRSDNRLSADIVLVRCFIQGVYMPFVDSISVSEGRGMVSGSIVLPYSHTMLTEEWEGLKVAIFWANRRVLKKFGPDPKNRSLSNWPILFNGEISGVNESASVSSKNVSFNLVSSNRHLHQTMLYFFDPSRNKDLDSIQQAAFLGNKEIKFETAGVLSKTTRLVEALRSGFELSDEDPDRFVAYQATIKSILDEAAASNGSYRLFSNQLNLSKRFNAYADPDVKSILTLQQWGNLIEKRVSAMDNYTPLMRLLEVCSNALRYNWINTCTPIYSRGVNYRVKNEVDEVEILRMKISFRSISKKLADLDGTVQLGRSEFRTVNTHPIRIPDVGTIIVNDDYLLRNLRNELKVIKTEDEFVELVKQRITSGGTLLDAITELIEDGYWVGAVNVATIGETEAAKKTQERLKQAEATRSGKQESIISQQVVENALLSRRADLLNEWLVVPDMTFSQPPKCNVITPNNIESYSISVDFFSMITRLYAAANFTKEAKEWYIAPSSGVFYRVNEDNTIAKISEGFDRLAPEDQTVFDLDNIEDEADE